MSEQGDELSDPGEDLPELSGEAEAAEPSQDVARPEVETTGHPAVDEVLRSLGRLDDQPVSEHVAVFEQAHETLRRTLNDAGDDAGSSQG